MAGRPSYYLYDCFSLFAEPAVVFPFLPPEANTRHLPAKSRLWDNTRSRIHSRTQPAAIPEFIKVKVVSPSHPVNSPSIVLSRISSFTIVPPVSPASLSTPIALPAVAPCRRRSISPAFPSSHPSFAFFLASLTSHISRGIHSSTRSAGISSCVRRHFSR
jgi:hypothetical protein